MDVLAEYQRLKKAAAMAEEQVIRAEATVAAAEQEAREAAADAKALGFGSLEEVVAKRDALLGEAEAAIARVREALV